MFFYYGCPILICSTIFGCDDEGDKKNSQRGPQEGKENFQQEPYSAPGHLAIVPTADLQDAFGLLVLENEVVESKNSESSTSSPAGTLATNLTKKSNETPNTLARKHNKRVLELGLNFPLFSDITNIDKTTQFGKIGDEIFDFGLTAKSFSLNESQDSLPAAMQKIDINTGEIKNALTQERPDSEHGSSIQELPNLATIAVSPTKEVYLHFERQFIYRDSPPDSDPWKDGSGYQCQIFKIKGGTLDNLLVTPPEKGNLECIDNMRHIDSWRANKNGVFQISRIYQTTQQQLHIV